MSEIVWESDSQSSGFTVMSNGMVWPDDWPGTLVEAQFTSARGDGADLDRDPDMVPSGPGRVTFTPRVRTVGYDGEHGKRIVSLHPFEAVVGDDGYLYTPDEYGQPGIRGIVLPSNNSDVVDEHDWTWRVTFDIPDTTIRPTNIPTPHDHNVDIKDYLDSDANHGVRVVVDRVAARETLTARDETLAARDEAQGYATTSGGFDTRLGQIEVMAGLEPGEVTDAQTANLIQQTSSVTRTALTSAVSDTSYPADAGTVVDLWEPPTQPVGPDLSQYDAEDLYAEWDALVAHDPEYVTKFSIGDGTDGLPIYAYAFTPPAPGNTIMLTAEHGGEKIAMYAALQMLRLMVTQWQGHPALAALRSRTRIVAVPIASRTAFTANARKNANGVDLNRNWDYQWAQYGSTDPSSVTYKGPAPFSEPEAQALRDLIYSLEADGGLVAALDLHDTGATPQPGGYHFFANTPYRTQHAGGTWVRQLANEIADTQHVTSPNTAITLSNQPQMMNWCAERGLWSATVEYEQRWGTNGMDSANQTAALRWIGNLIMRATTQPSSPTQPPQPWVKRLTFTAGSSRIPIPPGTSGAGHDIAELGFEFTPESAGLVEFYGHIMIGGADTAQVTVTPTVGQAGTNQSQDNPDTSYDSMFQYHQGGYASGGIIIPFSVTHAVVENPQWPVKVQIYAFSNPGESVVYRYRGNIKFTPSTSPDRFELYSATGRGGQGADAQQFVRGV